MALFAIYWGESNAYKESKSCCSFDRMIFGGENINIRLQYRHTPTQDTPPGLTIHVDGLVFEAIPRMGIFNPFHRVLRITKRHQLTLLICCFLCGIIIGIPLYGGYT